MGDGSISDVDSESGCVMALWLPSYSDFGNRCSEAHQQFVMCRGLCQCFALEGVGDMAGTWHQLTVPRGGARWGSMVAR